MVGFGVIRIQQNAAIKRAIERRPNGNMEESKFENPCMTSAMFVEPVIPYAKDIA